MNASVPVKEFRLFRYNGYLQRDCCRIISEEGVSPVLSTVSVIKAAFSDQERLISRSDHLYSEYVETRPNNIPTNV